MAQTLKKILKFYESKSSEISNTVDMIVFSPMRREMGRFGFFGKVHWTLAGTSSAFDHQRHSVYPSFTTLLVHQTTDPTMSCEFMLNQFLGSQTQIGDSPHQWDWEPCCFDIVAPKVRAGK